MAAKTGVTGKLRIQAEIFDDDLTALGENFNAAGALHAFEVLFPWACGTSDGQINMVWSDRGSVTASGTNVLDLAGGLTDPYGHTLTFTVIKLIILRNRSTTTGDILRIGPSATDSWVGFWADASDRTLCKPGIAGQPGMVILYDPVGIAVTAGSVDDLAIIEAGGANTVSYDILIAGEGTY